MCGKSRRQDTKQKKGLCVKRQKNSCHHHLPAHLLDLILIFRFFLLKLNQKASKEDSTSPSTHKMSRHLKILGKILSSHSQQADGEGKKEEKKKETNKMMIAGVRKLAAVCHNPQDVTHTKKEMKISFSSPFYRCQQSRRAHTLLLLSPDTRQRSKRTLTKHIPFVGPFVLSCERCERHQFFGCFSYFFFFSIL
jgi:hypothetical protein